MSNKPRKTQRFRGFFVFVVQQPCVGIQYGIENINPAADMRDVLKTVRPGHFAAITADELPAFLVAMNTNDARLYKPTRAELRLMLLVFVRTRMAG